jgi:catechol 2,3-dioxygenase
MGISGVDNNQLQGERRGLLADALRLGAAHLKVSSLDRSIPFYTDVLGLQLRARDAEIASLGVGGAEDLIVLHESPGAHSVSHHSGLYHVALLFPSRLELARVAQRIAETNTPIQGASDHGISEAIYLPDPDGNGIELAADQPRENWPDLSDITAIAPNPLDMGGLFNLVSGREAEPHADPLTVVGHVHLHVGSIDDGLAFYRELVGFDLVTYMDVAAFVSAGGYHHHLAFNTWQGVGAPAPPADAAGLLYWTVVLPSDDDVTAVRARLTGGGYDTTDVENGFEVRDPWQTAARFVRG